MLSTERERTYKRALYRWGMQAQVQIAIEEMAELTKALCKLSRFGLTPGVLESIEEELADVSIMIEQLEMMFEINLENAVSKKVNRLKERLDSLDALEEGK